MFGVDNPQSSQIREMVSQTDSVFRAAGFDDIQRLGSRLVSLICNEAETGEFKTEIILQPCLLLFFNSSSYLNAITLIVLLSLPFSCTVVVVSSSNRILCHVDGVKIKNTACLFSISKHFLFEYSLLNHSIICFYSSITRKQ